MLSYFPLTIRDVSTSMETLRTVKRPRGDNEGDPINHPAVYDHLPPKTQEDVDEAWHRIRNYCIQPDGQLNRRSISLLRKRGYDVYLGEDQYDPMRLVGYARFGDWEIDLSDAPNEE